MRRDLPRFPAATVNRAADRVGLGRAYRRVWGSGGVRHAGTFRARRAAARYDTDHQLGEPALELLRTMRRDGYVRAPASALLSADTYQRVHEQACRASEAAPRTGSTWYARLEPSTTLSDDNPAALVAHEPELVRLATAYLGLVPRLRSAMTMVTEPYEAERVGPQLWHRDADDIQTFKVNVMINGWDTQSGAMDYLPTTQRQGANQSILRGHDGVSVRYTDDELVGGLSAEAASHRPAPVVLDGDAGSLTLFDTSGLHRSSYDPDGGRLVVSLVFSTPMCLSPAGLVPPRGPRPSDPLVRAVLGYAA